MVPRNSYCPPAGRSCMTQCQKEQHFPDESQVSRHNNNKINIHTFLTRDAENFVSVHARTLSVPFKWAEMNFVDKMFINDLETPVSCSRSLSVF
jgi:hypothetical protein